MHKFRDVMIFQAMYILPDILFYFLYIIFAPGLDRNKKKIIGNFTGFVNFKNSYDSMIEDILRNTVV